MPRYGSCHEQGCMTEGGVSTAMQGQPLIFGEVLFDCFPHDEILGGAPFNVAWHLQGFGLAPLFISRIGNDVHGAQVSEAMRAWGMDTRGLQTDPDHPTGSVHISLHEHSHSFDILPDQAYDHIDAELALAATAQSKAALLYHGSLITRAPTAHAALMTLRAARKAPSFVDINLRDPWWDAAGIEALMRTAHWLKLNDDEMRRLRGQTASTQPQEKQAQQLRAELGVELLMLTRGEAGASYIGNKIYSGTPPAVTNFVDTVGAGDAFSAVSILGLLKGWPLPTTLERALLFAARICGQRGATAENHALYAEYRHAWSL